MRRLSLAALALTLLLPAVLLARAPGPPIEWKGALAWKTWDQGSAEAGKTGRPMLLLVYADWCPHCRNLAPVFSEKPVLEAARGLVMVRQAQDERPAWLTERFGRFGSYVPRTFLLHSDGRVMEDLVSGHPQYPYFYTPGKRDLMVENMKKAAARASRPVPPSRKPGR
jgi:thiol:disulfide interchange protein